MSRPRPPEAPPLEARPAWPAPAALRRADSVAWVWRHSAMARVAQGPAFLMLGSSVNPHLFRRVDGAWARRTGCREGLGADEALLKPGNGRNGTRPPAQARRGAAATPTRIIPDGGAREGWA